MSRQAKILAAIPIAALTASFVLSACSSSSSSAAGASSSTSVTSIDGSQSLAAACSKIRAKYTVPAQMTIGTSAEQRPSEYVNPSNPSQIIGLEPDLVTTLSQCMGFKYTYSNEAFENVIASVQSGRTPIGVEGVYVTPARVKVLDLIAYRVSEEEAIVAPDLASKITSVTSFCGLTGGVTTGSVELAYLQQVSAQCKKSGKPAITLNVYQDAGTIALSLADGRIDFSIGAAELVAPELTEFKGKINSSIIIPQLTFDIGVAVSKQDPALANAVLAAIQAIQANGLEKPMLQKWGYLASGQVPAKLYS
jgi:polar amino acid transport system substrate-binding protein